ncbi:MAG: stage 0 sporulation family protein [Chloroflexota bacterium]|nr:stage 0 sporulation family protein [Chloroflexota bacterium]
MNQVIGIRFQEVGKIYHFRNNVASDLNAGDFVVVETSRGLEMGWVAKVFPEMKGNSHKAILRKATTQDLLLRERYRHKEKEVLKQVRMAAVENNIRVKMAKAEYSFDGTRLTIYYGSEKEVDLNRLQRELSRRFETRVEFRQVGPRDVAKMMGGSGACGLAVRCCSAFLTDFQPISIRMAKVQDLPLVPSEIAGMCGRLRCCLAYEYEFYKDARKGMPKIGKWVQGHDVAGKIVDRNIPKQTVTIKTENGSRVELAVDHLWVGDSGESPAQGGSCGPNGDCTSCGRH